MCELSTYLSKATELLHEYQWVYNFRATHLLVNGIFSQIPEVWVQALLCLSDDDLNLLTAGVVKDGWATCLIDFIHKCHETTLPSTSTDHLPPSKDWEYVPDKLRKGMSPKKQHEVLHLASFIYQQCNYSNLSRILDLGSGLGYLGKLLHHQSGYRVLGLEADAGHVGRAVKMQQPICSSGVNHVALTINPAHRQEVWNTTVEQVRLALEDKANWGGRCSCGRAEEEDDRTGSPEKFDRKSSAPALKDCDLSGSEADNNVCVVSLHSCGDLSPTALRLFLKLPETKLLILLSCCYHKMKTLQVEVHIRSRTKVKIARSSTSGTAAAVGESKGGRRKKLSDDAEKVEEVDESHDSLEREVCSENKQNSRGTRNAVAGDSDGRSASSNSQNGPRAETKSKPFGSRKGNGKTERKAKVVTKVEKEEEFFPDFPMSAELKSLVSSRREFLKRPLLRLASEITVEMWRLMTAEQHDEHAVHVMGRAVLELYARKGGFKLKKKRRRGVRRTRLSNFDDYFGDALERFDLSPTSETEGSQSKGYGEGNGDAAASPHNSLVDTPPAEAERASDEATEGSSGTGPDRVRQRPARSLLSPRSVPSNVNGEGDGRLEDSNFCGEPEKKFFGLFFDGGLTALSSKDAIPYADDDEQATDLRHSGGDAEMVTSDGHDSLSFKRKVTGSPSRAGRTVEEPSVSVPVELHRQRLKDMTRELCTPEALRLTKALYALQAKIQSVAEGYILADRLAFLLEEGGSSTDASLVRIFDRSLSPRSLAIVARKKNFLSEDDK